ncbi:MAG: SLC13 family permease [Balneolaceae bacterium]|nr:SLC13 family permease [Balneolaceae bacterium]MBO6546954.1 SLC13 family permease [Balneolaceae bacterium]MBO6649314.1 SLC13 family permease [Balneolaceae bacterium]
MTLEGWSVIGVIVGCLILLITTNLSVDMVLLAGLAILLISGIIAPEAALSGFSNEGMLTVAALYVVAAGLKETGAIRYITQKVMGDVKTVRAAQTRIMMPVMVMSAFLNNTPIVASFIPALEHWSKSTRIPVSKILIPLSYAAILGGTCTLIGTSTNLILNGLLIEEGSVRALGLFEPAWIGVPCAIAGFIYLFLFGDKLLPSRGEAFESFKDPREYTIEMMVPEGSPLARKTIQEAELRQLPGLFLVEIYRDNGVLPAVGPDQRLREGDRLIFAGIVDSIVDLQNMQGLVPATNQVFKLDAPKDDRVLFEAVVSNSNPIKGRRIKEGKFRDRYNAVVLAVSRSGERLKEKIGDITLKTGDTLLLEAKKSFQRRYRNSNDFYLISPIKDVQSTNYDKSGLALSILFGMVLLAGFGILSMLQAAFLAGAIMILTKAIRYSVGIETIDWRVLIAIASSLGIGNALSSTGVAEHFAINMLSFANLNPITALIITYFITWILTELITNNAAAVLVFPIALSIAQSIGVDFIPFAIVIIMAASASFSTPVGYQTNLMIYGPGSYRYTDYIKIGLPLNLIIAALTVFLVPKIWSF